MSVDCILAAQPASVFDFHGMSAKENRRWLLDLLNQTLGYHCQHQAVQPQRIFIRAQPSASLFQKPEI